MGTSELHPHFVIMVASKNETSFEIINDEINCNWVIKKSCRPNLYAFLLSNLLDHVIHISLHILIINMTNMTMLCLVGSYVLPIVIPMMHNKVQHCYLRTLPYNTTNSSFVLWEWIYIQHVYGMEIHICVELFFIYIMMHMYAIVS